jgi:diguanylate cyclase (GGDEF)-like protein/PAS domain S-box-containing protein
VFEAMESRKVASKNKKKNRAASMRLNPRTKASQKNTLKMQGAAGRDVLAYRMERVPGSIFSARGFTDGHSEIVYASPGFEDVVGIPSDATHDTRRWLDAIHSDDVARVHQAVEKSKAQNLPLTVEYRIYHPRKGVVWIEVCAGFVAQPDGSRVWNGFVHDVSERKRAEAALLQREQRYRNVFDHMSDHIIIYDVIAAGRYRCVDVNEAAVSGLDTSREALIGRYAEDVVPPSVAAAALASLDHCRATKVAGQYDRTIAFPIGELSFHVTLVPIHSDDGSVDRIVMIATDTTEEVKLRQAQYETERYFETLVANSPDPIVRFDRDRRRVYINPAHSAAIPVPEGELVGKTFLEASTLDRQTAVDLHERLQRVIETGEPEETDVVIENPGRELSAFNIRFLPEREAAGRVVGVLEIARNITTRVVAERALRDREQEFRSLVENSTDLVVRYDRYARRIYANPSMQRALKRAQAQHSRWPGDNAALIDAEGFIATIHEVVATSSRREIQVEWRHPDGASHYYNVRFEPEFAADGGVASVLCISRGNTEFVEAQRELRRREREFRTLVENAPDFITRYDHLGQRVYMNPVTRRTFRHVGIESNTSPTENCALVDAEAFLAIVRSVLASGTGKEQEIEWLDREGATHFNHIRFVPEFDEQGSVTGVMSIGRDITEIALARKKIEAAASCDSLTGLPNRRHFNLRLAEYVAPDDLFDRPQFGLMFLDLDRFKDINDTLGHEAGDTLLFEVAARLLGCVRDSDIVARLGGDEFAIFLPATADIDDLCGFAARVLHTFTQPFYLSGREIFVSSSIGIARYPDDTIDIDELYRYADSAMYHAKNKGRNNYQFYTAEMTARSVQRLMLEATMRKALARDEFELYFQPQVFVETGELRGAEALIRWNHPELGFLLPGKFIPVAEDTGLIVELGNWVLSTACAAAVEWNKSRSTPFKISVNLSGRQFVMNDLVKSIHDILSATGCKAQWLELEVTESLLLEDDHGVRTALEALREMGVLIALDDFGTGYSALSYLDRFPIDVLKIDRTFVRDVEHDCKKLGLAKAIVSIADALHLHLIAEGVENESQAFILNELGCHVLQGFHYGRPMQQGEFTRRLKDADLAHTRRWLRNSA